jgi:hypothetical protein
LKASTLLESPGNYDDFRGKAQQQLQMLGLNSIEVLGKLLKKAFEMIRLQIGDGEYRYTFVLPSDWEEKQRTQYRQSIEMAGIGAVQRYFLKRWRLGPFTD